MTTGQIDEPRVTVVTPFYNTAAFLEEAIRSVLAQRYGNFEYILADNCSTDGSLAIAEKYAALDLRIRLLKHSEFLPQSANYNRALGAMSGDSHYCKIVQADDWIYPTCLSEMVALASANPQVGIVSCCYIAGEEIGGHGLPFERTVFSGREACRTRLLKGGTFFGSPTCLLYRADIVRGRELFFAPNETNADTTACFEILERTDFGLVPQILAGLRRNTNSTSDRLKALGTPLFMNWALVVRYGPRYLEPAELGERSETLEADYLRFLARASLRLPGTKFWAFHALNMATLGRRLPTAKIVWRVFDYVLDKLLNPRRTLESLLHASFGRRRNRH